MGSRSRRRDALAFYETLFPRQEALPLRTEPLFGEAPPVPPAKKGVLADLDVEDEHYELDASLRISNLEDLGKVEGAIAEVPNHFKKTVITLVVRSLGLRIAKLAQLLDRKTALEALSPDLRSMVEPYVRNYYQTKPWEGKKGRR